MTLTQELINRAKTEISRSSRGVSGEGLFVPALPHGHSYESYLELIVARESSLSSVTIIFDNQT